MGASLSNSQAAAGMARRNIHGVMNAIAKRKGNQGLQAREEAEADFDRKSRLGAPDW